MAELPYRTPKLRYKATKRHHREWTVVCIMTYREWIVDPLYRATIFRELTCQRIHYSSRSVAVVESAYKISSDFTGEAKHLHLSSSEAKYDARFNKISRLKPVLGLVSEIRAYSARLHDNGRLLGVELRPRYIQFCRKVKILGSL